MSPRTHTITPGVRSLMGGQRDSDERRGAKAGKTREWADPNRLVKKDRRGFDLRPWETNCGMGRSGFLDMIWLSSKVSRDEPCPGGHEKISSASDRAFLPR